MTTTSLQTLAADVRKFFTTIKRGEESIVTLTDDAPEWVRQLAMDAHGDMMPDDHRYAFIVEALDALVDADDPDEVTLASDIYTHDLLKWLASNLQRPGYCDEAFEEYGDDFRDTVSLIGMGQLREKEEVLDSVRSSLEAQLDDSAEDEETEDTGEGTPLAYKRGQQVRVRFTLPDGSPDWKVATYRDTLQAESALPAMDRPHLVMIEGTMYRFRDDEVEAFEYE